MRIGLRFTALVIAWFVVFALGLKVNASELDNSVLGITLYILSSTTTNIGFLAVIAALVCEEKWGPALRRGFTIYLASISGVVAFFSSSIQTPTPEQYSKLAALTSVIALLTSYKPQVFQIFLERIAAAIVGSSEND
jgi:hypothetical protein